MSYVKVKGIVIKEVNSGEADKILTVFSNSLGKLSVIARGARRPRSNLAAGAQLLCYSDMLLYKGRGMYHLNSCEVIESFYSLRSDIVKLTYTAHILEIVNDIVQEDQPSSKILKLFLNTLYFLTREDKQPEFITRVFELRLLTIAGYAPSVNGCIICGSRDVRNMFFSFRECGFICRCGDCISNDPHAMDILPGTAMALNHIVNSDMKDLFSFEVSSEVLSELGRISSRYLRERLEKDYNKLEFLKDIRL